MELKINPEFKNLIPPLSDVEYKQLEQNIMYHGLLDPIIVWNGTIVDGHNRYQICTANGMSFGTTQIEFRNDAEAKQWIIEHQLGRRNLSPYQRGLLALEYKDNISQVAKLNQGRRTDLLPEHKKDYEPVRTSHKIAKMADISHGTIAKVAVIEQNATAEIKDELRQGNISIHKAYADIKREQARVEALEKIESTKARYFGDVVWSGMYDCIVIDPPWPMKKIERDTHPEQVEFDYPTMTEAELEALEIPAADNCHVWLWTTQKFFDMACRLLDKWQFKRHEIFVWNKGGGFQPFGRPMYNCEFVIYATKGYPKFESFKDFKTCFTAPRQGHSVKPNEFYDMVRRVTSGKRLDMFNRRKIEGFDTWGNEAK